MQRRAHLDGDLVSLLDEVLLVGGLVALETLLELLDLLGHLDVVDGAVVEVLHDVLLLDGLCAVGGLLMDEVGGELAGREGGRHGDAGGAGRGSLGKAGRRGGSRFLKLGG